MKNINEELDQNQESRFKRILKYSKEFIKNHKEGIIAGLLFTGFGAGSMFLYKNKQIKNLNNSYMELEKEYADYKIVNEALHMVKDKMFDELASDATRHRSSLGGRRLREKGLYLQGK